MNRKIIITKDGSPSIEAGSGITYHSTHGAIQESQHIYIREGFRHLAPGKEPVHIFEMGMGTGLNVILTLLEAERVSRPVIYETIEAFPLEPDHLAALNYCTLLNRPDLQNSFEAIHSSPWEEPVRLSHSFTFYKAEKNLLDCTLRQPAGLVYFDAFAPDVQPELWSRPVFEKLYTQLLPGALLLTYCSKGEVRRSMLAAGFQVTKLPGPPGKKEILRATKPQDAPGPYAKE